jgi:hypothetical protein
MTRIQDEWDKTQGESACIDTSRFKFGAEELKRLSPRAIIMTPAAAARRNRHGGGQRPARHVLAADAQRHVGSGPL